MTKLTMAAALLTALCMAACEHPEPDDPDTTEATVTHTTHASGEGWGDDITIGITVEERP